LIINPKTGKAIEENTLAKVFATELSQAQAKVDLALRQAKGGGAPPWPAADHTPNEIEPPALTAAILQ
jgi:hypothetical protein